MQGTLYEIDIRSILQLIEQGQRTGELLVEAYPASLGASDKQEWELSRESRSSETKANGGVGQYWLVFFVGGKIVYAADRHSNSFIRLRDYLYSHRAEKAIDILQSASLATTNEPEYAYLWLLLEKGAILPERGRAIIESAIEEIVFDLLGLRRGTFIFESGDAIAPQLTALDVNPLLSKTMRQLQQWKQFHPYIQSPHQVFIINNEDKLKGALPAQAYESIARWADGKTSLRQLSRFLKRDLLTLSKGIYPYAERGWINLIDPVTSRKQKAASGFKTQNSQRSPQIVCIDDDLSIGKKVEYILIERGYRAIAIPNPIEALGKVFQLAPDIILCDITMPQLEGLEICAMLRRSSKFRQTPIIMLTGKENFTDRVRARMAGATDYLTKPFGENELLLLLEKYLHL
ncbi:response regulator [Candidatus Gracilibacteria bacterium]|nr:response regulator [Candidatus Gracilibacteria bacterium]NJM87701.1 response regulator [Hydrococcus sp. RU_2_2]NJP19406.1 response regulator [Hydrococcus sp. CRU_1_1]